MIAPSPLRLGEPVGVAGHRKVLLDGAILAIVFLAAAGSAAVHAAHPVTKQAALPSARAMTAPIKPVALRAAPAAIAPPSAAPQASPSPLPVLSPPVAKLAQSPAPASAVAAASTPSPSAAPSAVLPDPGAELTSAPPATTAAASSGGRLSRAQALPEVPMAAGAGSSNAATVLDQQYTDHTVVAGETLSSIANSYGVSLDTLMANNAGMDDFDLIHPGQTLRIPTTNGVLYHVQAGDTLDDISSRYGISVSDIVALKSNGLQSADAIVSGQTLLLPGDIKPPKPAPVLAKALPAPASGAPQVIAQAKPSASLASADTAAAAPAAAAPPAPPPPPPPPPTPAVPIARFIWPIQGPITQGFGVPELGVGAPHTGIDIGLYGRDGAPIAAAAAGTVTFSGGDPCCSYGYYVIIKHAGGFETLYGHLSRRAVTVGQQVAQGQTIGYAGSTGFSTGTHLHFEIHLNGALQNPLNYLP